MAGRPKETSDAEILELFLSADGGTLSTPEIKENLGYSQSGTWRRLNELQEKGLITGRETGRGNPTLWRITEDGEDYIDRDLDTIDMEGEGG